MSAADKPGAAEAPPTQVPCPNCRQPAMFAPANRWRPFCSERCRMIDLGAWANESYRVAAAPTQEDDDDLPEAAPPARPS